MLLSSRAAAMIRRMCSVGNTIAASRSNFLSTGLVKRDGDLAGLPLGLAVDGIDHASR